MTRDLPSDWTARAKNVYERDNYQCQNCNRKGGPYGDAELHAHHGVPRHKGGSHKLTNLTTYCKKCHNAIHYDSKIAPTTFSTSRRENTAALERIQPIIRRLSDMYRSINNLIGEISRILIDLIESETTSKQKKLISDYRQKSRMYQDEIAKARGIVKELEEVKIDSSNQRKFRDEYCACMSDLLELEQDTLDNYKQCVRISGGISEGEITVDIDGHSLRGNEFAERKSQHINQLNHIKSSYQFVK